MEQVGGPLEAEWRIGLFGLFHESHSFLRGETGIEAFCWRIGDEMRAPETSPQIAGYEEGLIAAGLEPVMLVDARAAPGPPVSKQVIDRAFDLLRQQLAIAGRLDGLMVGLHGAMCSHDIADLDGAVLQRLREIPGLERVPICGSLDLHANFSDEMSQCATALVGYKTNPHVDVREASRRAADLMSEWLQGVRLRTTWIHSGVILPPIATATKEEPMQSLMALATHWEAMEASIAAVNVFGGYAYSDAPTTGLSFSVVSRSESTVPNEILTELTSQLRARAAYSAPRHGEVEEVIRHLDASEAGEGPWLVVEPADNIGAGAGGDGTDLLRCLLDLDVRRSAVIVNDPISAQLAHHAGVGARVHMSIGGRSFSADSGPVAAVAEVLRVSDGRFHLSDPNSHMAAARGLLIDMGPSAVIRCGTDVTVLLTSRATPPNDLGQWRSQGVEPGEMRVIGIKAAVAHRQAYKPIARGEFLVATRGPCPSDITKLPYARIRRPVYPLDPMR